MGNVVDVTKADKYFVNLVNRIFKEGYDDINPRPKYRDGTNAHTKSVNHVMHTYDLSKDEWPFITLRPIAWKNAVKEIFWIYQDQTSDLSVLENKYDIHWWNEWESTIRPGTIGQRYGATVKKYDLINKLLKDIKEDPYGRHKVMSLWQEEDLKETDGLCPCAFQTIWNVRNTSDGKEYLDMVLIQRSSDWITAGNINGIQYCALLLMIAKATGYEPGVFTHFIANAQIYNRHEQAALEMLHDRDFIPCKPKLILDTNETDFYKFKPEDFKLEGYPLDEIKKKNPQFKLDLGI